MVTATVPLPPPPPPPTVLGPLQAARDKAASNRRTGGRARALLRFMWHPTTEYSAFAPLERKTLSIVSPNVTRGNGVRYGKKREGVQVLNVLNQERYNVQRLAGGPLTKRRERGCYRNWSLRFVGRE